MLWVIIMSLTFRLIAPLYKGTWLVAGRTVRAFLADDVWGGTRWLVIVGSIMLSAILIATDDTLGDGQGTPTMAPPGSGQIRCECAGTAKLRPHGRGSSSRLVLSLDWSINLSAKIKVTCH